MDTPVPPAITLPPLREVIEKHQLGAKKSLGQHFLLDLNITRKIARLSGLQPGDTAIEVGPGPGGLTRALLETGAKVIAIERDSRCLAALAELSEAYPGQLKIIAEDALNVSEVELINTASGAVRLISNLPYNISTELLVKWLQASPVWWVSLTLMFQKEVGDRILAAPGSKTFGRLSIISQAVTNVSRGFDLPARAFTPPPKIDSSVLHFTPKTTPPAHLTHLEMVTAAAFSQRRKMLRSSLKTLFQNRTEAVLKACDILPTQRAEDVDIDGFLRLSAQLDQLSP